MGSFPNALPYLTNPDNRFNGPIPMNPRPLDTYLDGTAPDVPPTCDHCFGLGIPTFTPSELEISVSAIAVVDTTITAIPGGAQSAVNNASLFSTAALAGRTLKALPAFNPTFVGLLSRIRAQTDPVTGYARPYTDKITAMTQNEAFYLRPSFKGTGQSYGLVQSAVSPGYEWYRMRQQAFSPTGDVNTGPWVFEGDSNMEEAIETAAGNLKANMPAAINTIRMTYSDSDTITASLNGVPIKSGVTGEDMDRTVLGGLVPNNRKDTMSAVMVEAGVFACLSYVKITDVDPPPCDSWCSEYTCGAASCAGCTAPICNVHAARKCSYWCNAFTTWSSFCTGCDF
jgi:hypothetical protein